MASGSCSAEVPEQDFMEIQAVILGSRHASRSLIPEDELFEDPAFPPDISSLTYVYSGDDKYEKMTFKRPKVSTV